MSPLSISPFPLNQKLLAAPTPSKKRHEKHDLCTTITVYDPSITITVAPPEFELAAAVEAADALGGGGGAFVPASGDVPFNAAGAGGGFFPTSAVEFAAAFGGGGAFDTFGSAACVALPLAAGGEGGFLPVSGAVPFFAPFPALPVSGAVLFNAAAPTLPPPVEFAEMVVLDTIVAVPFATLGIAVAPAPEDRVTVLVIVFAGLDTVDVTFWPATSCVIVVVVEG